MNNEVMIEVQGCSWQKVPAEKGRSVRVHLGEGTLVGEYRIASTGRYHGTIEGTDGQSVVVNLLHGPQVTVPSVGGVWAC